MGIFRKYMTRTAEEEPEQRDSFAMSLAMFEFFMDVQDLLPAAAVRVVDQDVSLEFAFRVDFDPAPDLEDPAEAEKRQQRLFEV